MPSPSLAFMRGLRGPIAEETALLRAAATTVRTVGPRHDLLSDGDTPNEAYLILDGWGILYKDLSEGRRQILSFLLPGDLCLNAPDEPLSHCVASLTSLRYGALPLAQIDGLMAASPKFARAVWRKQLATSAIQLEWIANSGRPAYERIAHLLCEIFARAQTAGLADAQSCDFPATQFDLACALGLTSVHVNRMLQQLRRDRLIELRAKKLVLLDADRLGAAAQFDRSYLHLSAA